MTNEAAQIGRLLANVSVGRGWHGSSLRSLLGDVTAEEAAAQPLRASHSIWQVVLHIIAWRKVLTGLLEGSSVTSIPDKENWPVVKDTSDQAWRETLKSLEASGERLGQLLAEFRDDRLDEPAAAYAGKSANPIRYYALLHGLIHHDVYHAGQIAVLRNAQR